MSGDPTGQSDVGMEHVYDLTEENYQRYGAALRDEVVPSLRWSHQGPYKAFPDVRGFRC